MCHDATSIALKAAGNAAGLQQDIQRSLLGGVGTGNGGVIHDKARQWLKAQERNGKVKSVIFGEDFSIFNFKSLELKNRYRELNPLMKVCNHGVTVVEL